MKTVTFDQMRKLDLRTIEEAGMTGRRLMKNAGVGAAEYIIDFIARIHPEHKKRFAILAGKGNNGGDAYVVADYLAKHTNIPTLIYSVCKISELNGDAHYYAKHISEKVSVCIPEDIPEIRKGDIVIDALLGTGTKGKLRSPYDKWIAAVNSSAVPVISLDIPSGLHEKSYSETGIIRADLTITMGLPKSLFLLDKTTQLCGQIKCVDIGIPQTYINEIESATEMFFKQDISHLKRRSAASHKNSNGRVLVIAGSRDYPGAPVLTAKSALRSGAGMVTLAVPAGSEIPRPSMHSLIYRELPTSLPGFFSEESISYLTELADKADILAIGPGISTAKETQKMLAGILNLNKTTVLDADALNIIALHPDIIQTASSKIITPHPGELKRLLKGFNIKDTGNRISNAKQISKKLNAITVLKGNRTVIASPDSRITVNSSGTPALATAGTGDVLTGIISALASNSNSLFAATAESVFIHGICGEITGKGIRGTIADDILDVIPDAMLKLSPFA